MNGCGTTLCIAEIGRDGKQLTTADVQCMQLALNVPKHRFYNLNTDKPTRLRYYLYKKRNWSFKAPSPSYKDFKMKVHSIALNPSTDSLSPQWHAPTSEASKRLSIDITVPVIKHQSQDDAHLTPGRSRLDAPPPLPRASERIR